MTDSPKIIIRDATPADAEAIIRMHAQSWLDTYPSDQYGITEAWVRAHAEEWTKPERLESRRQYIAKSYASPDMMYKIAVSGEGTVIGFACPFRDREQQRLGGLYVDKTYHGTGVAAALMGEVLRWADSSRPITLEVAAYNVRARRFYEKYGFVTVDNSEQLFRGKIPIVTMIRKAQSS